MLWSKSSVRSVRYGRALNTTHCNMLPRLSDDHPVSPSSQMQQILNMNPTQRFPAICWDLPIHSAGSGATDCWYPRLHQSHVILSVWKSNLRWFSTTASHGIGSPLGMSTRTASGATDACVWQMHLIILPMHIRFWMQGIHNTNRYPMSRKYGRSTFWRDWVQQ